MTKFSDEETKKLIYLKNNEVYNKKFEMFKTNPHKITLVWNEITSELNNKFSVTEFREKYNNLIKRFRKLYLESHKSGSGGIRWKFYQDILHSEIKGCELVAPNCRDSLTIEDDENFKGELASVCV
ncbi:hypothetical protein A0H76_1271 [Hepatospora eriocheir]|uniref:Myb/SANT-like DNA-binding domain-containing protein n=1 Tax=Hepatospora eriocheir TaxID=1081669 RepID=A0A1X0Q609_9MICR|nr:hypothetical protein A0H76_1271 [Hepatospora eriocheir]